MQKPRPSPSRRAFLTSAAAAGVMVATRRTR